MNEEEGEEEGEKMEGEEEELTAGAWRKVWEREGGGKATHGVSGSDGRSDPMAVWENVLTL